MKICTDDEKSTGLAQRYFNIQQGGNISPLSFSTSNLPVSSWIQICSILCYNNGGAMLEQLSNTAGNTDIMTKCDLIDKMLSKYFYLTTDSPRSLNICSS